MAKQKQTVKTHSLQTKMHQARFLVALEKTMGIVSVAARDCGIDRNKHYDWMKEDEEYRAKVDSLSDLMVDFAESSLMRQVKDGQTAATLFVLKCKGKKRGWIDTQYVSADGDLSVTIVDSI